MKKQLLIILSFILFSSAAVFAQSGMQVMKNPAVPENKLSLGSFENGSTTSVMEILESPVLLVPDDQKVVSYELKIISKEEKAPKVIKIEGATLNYEAIDYLRDAAGEKGTITVGKVVTQKGDVIFETPYYLEMAFNQ